MIFGVDKSNLHFTKIHHFIVFFFFSTFSYNKQHCRRIRLKRIFNSNLIEQDLFLMRQPDKNMYTVAYSFL